MYLVMHVVHMCVCGAYITCHSLLCVWTCIHATMMHVCLHVCVHISVCACGEYMFSLLISLKLIKVASSGRHKTKKHRSYNSLQVVFHAWKVVLFMKSTWKHLQSERDMKVKSTWKTHLKRENHIKSTWKVKNTWKVKAHEKHTSKVKIHEKHTSKLKST